MAYVKKKDRNDINAAPVKTSKTSSLRDLIEKVEWVTIEANRGVGGKLPPDHIAVAFTKSKKDNEFADRMTVRIGAHVLNKLNWDYGDKIVPMYNPDNIFQFLLCKSGHHTGYTISKETQSAVGSINIPWHNLLKKPFKPSAMIDHVIEKGYLSFTIDNE
jgi:hypothetical protein